MGEALLYSDLLTDDLILHGAIGATVSPERSLLEAMLFRTADDLRKYPLDSLIHHNALAWVLAESYEPHGFGWLCTFLGLNPQAAAQAMLQGQGLGPRERFRFNVMTPVKQRVREQVRALRARRAHGE